MGNSYRISDAGRAFIQQNEGLRLAVYDDGVGNKTIGYGHEITSQDGFLTEISKSTADVLFARDCTIVEGSMLRLVNVVLSQNQVDALADFIFNIGAFKFQHSRLREEINAGRFYNVPSLLMQWDHEGAKEIEALKHRRERESEIWRGAYPKGK